MADCKLAVLISGRGSNLQAIIKANQDKTLSAHIALVISNRADATGLALARDAGIETCVIEHDSYNTRDAFDAVMMDEIDSRDIDLVVLAGFMRILSEGFIDHYAGRILNIHPSLLPDLKGLNTHQRALDAGYTQHGASVHFVNSELDSGAVVVQAMVDIEMSDDASSLAGKVLSQEHIIYPMAIQWFADRRLTCDDDNVMFDDERLQRPLIWKHNSLVRS